jgi:hypothetical protein
MSLFVNFRAGSIGGAVVDPYVIEGDPVAIPLALRSVPWPEVSGLVAGRDVLFGVHGFNVGYSGGVRALGRLDAYLALGASEVFLGVLWPGDSWLPVVNYPFEGATSIRCGNLLAGFCEAHLAAARSFSFVSHSLGARVVLQAAQQLQDRFRIRAICLTAGAINDDCLQEEYGCVPKNAERILLLASHCDEVLKLAFPIGDLIADLLHDDHTPFRTALGYGGPQLPAPSPVRAPWQIPDHADYGHHNYLPPGEADPGAPTPDQLKWQAVAKFARRAFRGEEQSWPG